MDGLSVVSANGTRHAVMLVSDLEKNDLTRLAEIVSLPLVQRLAGATSDRTTTSAWRLAEPVHELAPYSDRRSRHTVLLAEGLLTR